jgi:hypothetical protein
MDENKLADLLKDAVADTPPPTFTHADVTAESERQRVRHRNGLLAGSAFGVALLAGASALAVALWTGPETVGGALEAESSASGGNGNAAPYELPNEDNGAAAPTERGGPENFPPETPKQGGSSDGNGGPAGPASTPSGCEQADRELAAALAGELPAAANIEIDDADPVPSVCLAGIRAASFDVPDGRISVLLVPNGVPMTTDTSRPGSQATAVTDDGRQVVVVSEPAAAGEAVPFESDLARIAEDLARLY